MILGLYILFAAVAQSRGTDDRMLSLVPEVKSFSIPSNISREFVQGTFSTANLDSHFYASCNTINATVEKNCTVVQMRRMNEDKICNEVKISAANYSELLFGGGLQLVPLNQDNVALTWWSHKTGWFYNEHYTFHIGILNMEKCSMKNLEFLIDRIDYGFFPTIIPQPKGLDVVLNSRNSCGNVNHCRLSYGLDGKIVSSVVLYPPYPPEPYEKPQSYALIYNSYANPISNGPLGKSFYQYIPYRNGFKLMRVNTTGHYKEILNVPDHKKFGRRVTFDSDHEKYSICWVDLYKDTVKTGVICIQFNRLGDLVLNIGLVVEEEVTWVLVRNPPWDGLVIVMSNCSGFMKSDKFHCSFRIYKGGDSYRIDQNQYTQLSMLNFNDCYDMGANGETRLQLRTSGTNDFLCYDFSCLDKNKKNLTYISYCPRHFGYGNNLAKS